MTRTYARGFTLIELAVVLVIVAFLSGGAVMVLRMQMQHARLVSTQNALEDAREAILGYAEVMGGLPCPAGDITGGGDEPASCTKLNGLLPWQRLGLPQGEQKSGVDAWGTPLHYMVSPAFLKASSPTITPSMTSEGSIHINDGNSDVRNPKAIAFVIWSAGDDKTDSSIVTGNDQKLMIPSATVKSDDLVIWTSRYALIGRMLSTGRVLPE